jgi:hypothetical protein
MTGASRPGSSHSPEPPSAVGGEHRQIRPRTREARTTQGLPGGGFVQVGRHWLPLSSFRSVHREVLNRAQAENDDTGATLYPWQESPLRRFSTPTADRSGIARGHSIGLPSMRTIGSPPTPSLRISALLSPTTPVSERPSAAVILDQGLVAGALWLGDVRFREGSPDA